MTRLGIPGALLALLLGSQHLVAQQPKQSAGDTTHHMMRMSRQHMRAMDSMNVRLDSLVAQMNRTSGNAKISAMAEVINELVSQRRVMEEHMRQMMSAHGDMRRGKMMKMNSQPQGADTSRP